MDGRYRITSVRMQLLVLRGRRGFERILLEQRSFLKVLASWHLLMLMKRKPKKSKWRYLEARYSSVYHITILVLGLQFTVGPYFLSHKFELKLVDICVSSWQIFVSFKYSPLLSWNFLACVCVYVWWGYAWQASLTLNFGHTQRKD